MEELINKAKKITEELLNRMGVDGAAEVTVKDSVLYISIDTEETGLLIGYHGETLQSLQLLVKMMVNQGREDWAQVVVDIGDYREQREDALGRMVSIAAKKARETGEPQELPIMSAYERRLVHMSVSEEEGVTSESSGEGKNRKVVVKPA